MDHNKTTSQFKRNRSNASPQLRVRTNLRGGESVEACMNNLSTWQNEYYKWYNQVKGKKSTPC